MLILGVVNEVPEPKKLPPLDASYQSRVAPEDAVPDKETVPVPVREFGVVPVTVGKALTTADPVATFCVVAPDEVMVMLPEAPLLAKLDKRIYFFERESGILVHFADAGRSNLIVGYDVVDEEKFSWFLLKWS